MAINKPYLYRHLLGAGTGIVIILLLGLVPQPEDKIVFLDVGQGDAILFQHGMEQMLIDGGEGSVVLERLAEELPWFDKKIEVVVMSHPQRDHMEGLLHVLERFEVGMVLFPKAAHTSQLQQAWLEKLEEKDIAYRFAWQGQRLALGPIQSIVLGPLDTQETKSLIKKDVNNASTMMRVDYHGLSLLLTGDAEQVTEYMLVQHTPRELLDVDIFKAGHHGSKTSTTAQLLAASTPRGVVISVGENNRFGHPHPTVLSRLKGIPVWRTDQDGSVAFYYANGKWRGREH